MFGFVRQSTYDAAIDAIAARDAEIRELSEINYALDRTAAKYKQERNDARAQLKVFTGPRDRGPGGRFVKVQAQRPNGAAAAYPIPGSAADVSPATHRTIS